MHVSIDAVEAGMELAADINDANGRLLLPAGTTLTDKHIRYFQMWGILQIDVVADGVVIDAEPVVDPALLSAAETALAPRFAHTDRRHPAVAALFAYCVAVHVSRSL